MLSVFQPDVPFDDIYGGGEGLTWRDRAVGAGGGLGGEGTVLCTEDNFVFGQI